MFYRILLDKLSIIPYNVIVLPCHNRMEKEIGMYKINISKIKVGQFFEVVVLLFITFGIWFGGWKFLLTIPENTPNFTSYCAGVLTGPVYTLISIPIVKLFIKYYANIFQREEDSQEKEGRE